MRSLCSPTAPRLLLGESFLTVMQLPVAALANLRYR